MINKVNYYEILNVSKDASDVEIKRAFRRLSLELHPDKSENNDNDSKYKQVVEAYNILGNSEKRNEYNKSYNENRLTQSKLNLNNRNYHYDRERHYRSKNNYYKRNRNIVGYNDYSDYSDDENIDDNERNSYNCKRNYDYTYEEQLQLNKHNKQLQKLENNISELEDIRINRIISMEESYTGVSAPLNIKRTVNDVEESAVVYIDIPEGTDDGEIIILEGKGNIKGNYRSNIRVKVNVEQHLYFKRDKMNLVYNIDISLKEALCGFKREITHLDGKQYMIGSETGKIVQQNSRRCIPNKGFQRGQSIGNLIINFNIIMPNNLSIEQIDILRKILN
jgi:DnaJ-class molecular chaperone